MQVQKKSLKINFIMNSILTMSSFLFPLITFPYVSRILLPLGTGKVSFATSVISYFSMFSQLGIPVYGIRACAKVRDDKAALSKIFQELLIINGATSLITYLFFLLTLFTVPRLQQEKPLFLIVSLTILLNTIGVEWLYKSLEQYVYIAVRSIFFKFLALAATFLLIHQESDYVLYGAISIFAASASNILNFFHMRKFVSLKPVGNYHLKRHLHAVLIFFAMSCATTVYTHLDTVMLGFLKTDTDVGYYNAAVKIKSILVSIVTSLGVVLLPRASYYIEHRQQSKFFNVSEKALNFVCLLSIPLMVYFILFAKEGILFLSGAAYLPAILPMQIIMPTLLLIGLTNIMGMQMLVPLGKEKIVLYSEIVGAILNLSLNILLIPHYSCSGAAFGTLAAEFSVFLIQFLVLKKDIIKMYCSIPVFPIILGVLIGSSVSLPLKLLQIPVFFTLLLSAVLFWGIYMVTLLCFKVPLILDIKNQFLKSLKLK